MNVRHPAVAGSFYPTDEATIRQTLDHLLPAEVPAIRGELRALIAPHAGWRYSGSLLARAVGLLRQYVTQLGDCRLRIVHVGPSHHENFMGAALSSHDAWETPVGSTSVLRPASPPAPGPVRELAGPHLPEHCLEVQLPMLQLLLDRFEYIPLLTGQVEPHRLADELESLELIPGGEQDRSAATVFLVSTDLSHFHPEARARELDGLCNVAIPALDIPRVERSGELCGKTAVLALMHLAQRRGWRGELLGYMTSADAGAPRMEVVGYGAYAFWGTDASGP